MIQNKDYILQIIEAIGRGVAKIIGLKEKGQYTKALEELELCYSEHFDLMHIETESNYLKLDMYGELLNHEAEINIELGDYGKAKDLYLKALQSLTKAEKESKSFDMKRIGMMSEIQSALSLSKKQNP
jgi:tetratricopeptide (TPR) repeat protein